MNLKVRDVDLENGNVYPETAKHGKPRGLRLTAKTLNLLKTHIVKRDLGQNDLLFKGETSEGYGKSFRRIRNRLSEKISKSDYFYI